MNNTISSSENFISENFSEAIRLWEYAEISLLDIRHILISAETPIRGYHLPASAFIYTSGAKAEISLDDISYSIVRYGIFHGGKGTELSIIPIGDWLEYYIVLYKAVEPTFRKRDYSKLIKQTNPFRQQYSFEPSNPIFISELLRRMFEVWKRPTSLERFFEKLAFYQLVYEVYKEMDSGKINILQPDIVAMVKKYIDEHYREEISIQSIASILGISDSHLRRIFKKKYNKSPQEYLIQTRIQYAKDLLVQESTTIRSIAVASGFSDEFNFSRSFLKSVGISPRDYRAKVSKRMSDSAMDINNLSSYNKQGQVSLCKLKEEGEIRMFNLRRNKSVVAVALSLMILLTACNTTAQKDSGLDTESNLQVTSQALKPEETEVVEDGTRIVSTVLGDVEVPVNPQRVVVQYLMGDVVALGIIPVGVSDVYDGAAFSTMVTDSTSLGWFPEWEQESVMALDPDLILVIDEKDVNEYSKIAPTILIPYGDMTQNERVTFLGEVLNRQKEAAEAISAYEAGKEEAKIKLSQAGFDAYTISVFEGGADGTMSVKGDHYGTGSILYKELDLHAPKGVQTNIINKDSGGESVSFEVLSEYSGDFIVRNTYEGMADLSNDTIWNSLPAIKNNRVIGIEFGLSYYPDILSATEQLTFVTEELLRMAE